MRRSSAIVPLVLASFACKEGVFSTGERTPTSFGRLTKVERRSTVALSGESKPEISAPAGQTLLLLWFEGKGELRFDASRPNYPLVDNASREYPLYYAGSPTGTGALTCERWEFVQGGRLSMGGRWVYGGRAKLPEAKVVLVYVVPAGTRDLKLKDGDTSRSLDVTP